MVEFLNYLQEKDKMIRQFKFFHGVTIQTEGIQGIIRTLRAQWRHEDLTDYLILDNETVNLLSGRIAQEVDNEIINELTRRINGGQIA